MLEPLPAGQWTRATAAHLLNRAGFGGPPAAVEQLWRLGLDRAVDSLVLYEQVPDSPPLPEAAQPDRDAYAQLQAIRRVADPELKREAERRDNRRVNRNIMELRYWWLRRMAYGPRPLQEKLTLFWHGHFATSFEKVRQPYLLWQQNETLRRQAAGKFYDLLVAVAKDPAMLLYLDGATSRKSRPNENFAREVLELFTLGEGHYSESDIQESAKAYTGWSLAKDRLGSAFDPKNHDPGPKTFLGQTGSFTGEEALRVIAQNPACATFLVGKLWRFFTQDQPPIPVVAALAAEFRAHDLDLRRLLGRMFRAREFYAPEVIRAQVKSPVQWLVSSALQLQAPLPPAPIALTMLAQLGQDLFLPPNVKGWDGGIAWITTNNLLDRYNFAAELVEGSNVPLPGLRGRARGIAALLGEGPVLMEMPPGNLRDLFRPIDLTRTELFLPALEERFLHGPLKPQRRASLETFLSGQAPFSEPVVRTAIRLLMSTPDYQLT